jgi:hypothetical protein
MSAAPSHDFNEMEAALRERLEGLPPGCSRRAAPCPYTPRILPAFERADRIGEFWGYPESRAFGELLIDCQEDGTLRAVLVGM